MRQNSVTHVRPPDFTLTGWLSPEGDYYPTQGWGYLHEELAQLICIENDWEFEAVYGGTTAQRNLVFNGFIRFDHMDIDFHEQPTLVQIEEIRKMHQWKLANSDADDYRDYTCWRYIGEFLQWCDHDPTLWYEDAESFDDKLKKRGQIIMGDPVDDDDAPDITSQAWEDEMHEAFWDHWNAKALENAYMPNPADDRCEA